MSTWRPALRIARREVLRAKGRSLLVTAMVGLPVALVTCFTTVVATDDVSTVEALPYQLGATAAEVSVYADEPVWQDPERIEYETLSRSAAEDGNVSPALPPPDPATERARLQQLTGGRIIDVATSSTIVRSDRFRLPAAVLSADATSPQLRDMVVLEQGRLPRSPGEVVVSHALAERGYTVGSTIGLADGHVQATVVGVGTAPRLGSSRTIVTPAGQAPGTDGVDHTFLLDRTTPVGWDEVQRLNKAGVVVYSRSVVQDPPANWQDTLPEGAQVSEPSSNTAETAVLVLIVFSIVLEVVLLAGPAFAVGVRRQSRQLALVSATGGSARDVRRIVLAQSLTLGAGASVLGAGIGIALARGFAWALPRYRGTPLGPWDVDWRSTAAAVILGSVAAIVAAWAPARAAARTDVVAVLAGRRGQTRTRRGWPALGGLLIALGAVTVFTAGIKPGGSWAVVGGTTLMVLGAIAAMPALIGLVGRLGTHLPLPLRLATRDSARQRGRTAPAVAAVMAAVAGITALSIGVTSDTAQRRLDYQPRLPAGTTLVQVGDLDAAGWATIDRALTARTGQPVRPLGQLGDVRADGTQLHPSTAYVRLPGCPATEPAVDENNRCDSWQVWGEPRTHDSWNSRGPVVTDADALTDLGYAVGEQQRKVLADGGMLVPATALIVDGKATVTLSQVTDEGVTTSSRKLTLPAAHLPSRDAEGVTEVVDLAITPATAAAHHLTWGRTGGVLSSPDHSTALTTSDQKQLTESLSGVAPYIDLYTERGFVNDLGLPLIGLAILGALAVLVGTLTATGLALADARPDLATLAAVGARPRTRRVMAAAQALVIGLLGAGTGVLIGLAPGIAVTWPLTATFGTATDGPGHGPIIAIPWLVLLGVGLAVPVIAAMSAGLGVRSRLPLTRRLGQ